MWKHSCALEFLKTTALCYISLRPLIFSCEVLEKQHLL